MAGPRKTTGGTTKGRTPGSKTTGATAGKKAATPAKSKIPAMKLVGSAPKTDAAAAAPGNTPEITVVSPAEPVVAARQLKKVEFIDRVVEATGMKRKDVKPVVEATLAELNKVIAEGLNLQAPELGKLMIHKRKEVPNGEMVMLKLRRKTAPKALAKDDDNG